MNVVDGILRENKILTEGELDYARSLEKKELCTIESTRYIKCVYREDEDFHFVPDKSCGAEIDIKESDQRFICPGCERTIYKSDKTVFERYESTPDSSGIINLFIDGLEDISVNDIKKRPSGRKYGCFRVQPLVEVYCDGTLIRIPLLINNFEESLVEWLCVYSDTLVPLLTGDAVSLSPRMEDLNIPHLFVGELLLSESEDWEKNVEKLFQIESEKGKYWNIDHRAELSHEKTKNDSNLKIISSTDFEHIVHNFLIYVLGSSELFGATKSGEGYPDGVFSLSKPNKLFMWDAKFIRDYSKGDETTLSGEYDKIFRHLVQLRNNEHVKRKFSDVAGIVLFSPRVKPSNVHRLAEFINEQRNTEGDDWSGWVVSFDFDSLRLLYLYSKRNKYGILQKPNSLQTGLDSLMTKPARHKNEPDPIANSSYQCLNVSLKDMEMLFEEYVQHQDIEGVEFNREAYETDIEWNY